MNKYGRLAMEHWQQAAPLRVAELESPEAFFTAIGEQVMDQVVDLLPQIQGQDKPGEEYLAKIGRLNMARKQAEEIALNELVWIKEPEPGSKKEELENLLSEMPSVGVSWDVEQRIRRDAEREAEENGFEAPIIEDWQLEKIEQYKTLDRWLWLEKEIEDMTETEIEAHLQGIRAFQAWEEAQNALWTRIS